MADTQLQLTNSKDWTFRGKVSKTAKTEIINKRERHLFIPKFELNLSLNSRFIAVEILVKEAKPTWNAGGYLNQFYPVPFATQSSPLKRAVGNSKFLLINRTNLVIFPRISATSYQLYYSPPTWFRDVTVKVWQYTGEEYNFTDETVKSIEEKVDQLL